MAEDHARTGAPEPSTPGPGNGEDSPKTAEVKKPDKSETSRIELSDAESPAPEARGGEPVSVREVLLGETGKLSTARITLQGPAGAGAEPGDKSATSRIDLDAAEKPSTEEAASIAKDSTVRMDLTGAGAAVHAAQMNRTARIRIEEEPLADAPHGATARIEPEGVAVPPEPPKTQTPRTVRLQRPTAMPKTVVLRKPGDAAAESGKSTTAKISVPEGAAAAGASTQRKTIRIKRSDGPSSSSKTLTIARPGAASPSAASEQQLQEILGAVREDAGPAFSVLALVALLVMAVLVYVLAAQTVAPSLPFPGRVL